MSFFLQSLGRIFLYLHWLSLSIMRMWNHSDHQSFSGKESAQLHGRSLSGDCLHHQSYRSFRHLFCLWQFHLKIYLLASSGSHCCCFGDWYFLGFFWKEPYSKENSITCHEHDFSHLSPARKSFRSLYRLLMSFSIWGVTWSLVVSLRLSCRSMSRLDPDLYQC